MSGLRLVGEVSLDGAGFERGLNKIGHSAADNLKHLVIGAFGIVGVEQAIHRTVERAEELVNTSKRMHETVESVQLISQAAKDAGIDVGTVASAFEKLNIARSKALKGDKGALAAFGQFGVGQLDLQTKSAFDIAKGGISEGVKGKSIEEISGSLREIFGKGFGAVIPFLTSDFEDLHKQMSALGTLMDTDTAVKLHTLGNEFSLLANLLTTLLAPAIIKTVEDIISGIGKYLEWLDKKMHGSSESTKAEQDRAAEIATHGKIYSGAAALLNGLFGFAYLGMGAAGSDKFQKKGDDKILLSYEYFKQAGFEGGAVQSLADAIAKASSKGSLGEAFHTTIDAFHKKMEEDAYNLSHPKPPNLEDESKAAKVPHQKQIASDALVSVGNFLGAGSGLVNSTAEKHLQIAQKQLTAQEITNKALSSVLQYVSIIAAASGSGDDLNFPP